MNDPILTTYISDRITLIKALINVAKEQRKKNMQPELINKIYILAGSIAHQLDEYHEYKDLFSTITPDILEVLSSIYQTEIENNDKRKE